jgi:DNA-binding response OmpR family regulator
MAYRERAGGAGQQRSGLLIVDSDVLVRHALADYLRNCGYRVVEADGEVAAKELLGDAVRASRIDIVLCDAELADGSGFGLRAWARSEWPDLPVILAGNVDSAAKAAGELCDEGPHLTRPYDPQLVADRIKRLMAARGRAVF